MSILSIFIRFLWNTPTVGNIQHFSSLMFCTFYLVGITWNWENMPQMSNVPIRSRIHWQSLLAIMPPSYICLGQLDINRIVSINRYWKKKIAEDLCSRFWNHIFSIFVFFLAVAIRGSQRKCNRWYFRSKLRRCQNGSRLFKWTLYLGANQNPRRWTLGSSSLASSFATGPWIGPRARRFRREQKPT